MKCCTRRFSSLSLSTLLYISLFQFFKETEQCLIVLNNLHYYGSCIWNSITLNLQTSSLKHFYLIFRIVHSYKTCTGPPLFLIFLVLNNCFIINQIISCNSNMMNSLLYNSGSCISMIKFYNLKKNLKKFKYF